jgi:hypothetical protein
MGPKQQSLQMWVDVTGVKGRYKCCVTYLRFSHSVTDQMNVAH